MTIFDSKKMSNRHKEERRKQEQQQLRKHLKKESQQRINDIADFNLNNMKDVFDTTNRMINFIGNNSHKVASKFYDDENIGKKFYEKLNNNKFFKTLLEIKPDYLVKSQSGDTFIENVKNINIISASPTRNIEMTSYKNVSKAGAKLVDVKKNGGNIVSFDLETLGGINKYGHQQIDFITEISVTERLFNSKTNELTEVKSINSLLGFSNKEYKNLVEHLNTIKDTPYNNLSGSDQVLLSRLSMMSDKGIKIKKDGFEVKIIDTKEAKNIDVNVENALKGAKRYKEIGEYQEKWIKSNARKNINYENYRKDYVKKAIDLLSGNERDSKGNIISSHDVLVLGQNSMVFDVPVLEHYTDSKVNIKNHFDHYQLTKYVEEYLGQGSNIDYTKNKNGSYTRTSNKFGTGTQDQLKYMFTPELKAISEKIGVDLTQSHNAHIDETVLTHLIFQTDLFNKISSNLKKLDKVVPTNPNVLKNSLFLMNKTSKLNKNGHKNSLNFVYDSIDKSFKSYDSFRIKSNGEIAKESYNAFGPKEGALYTHELYEIDLNKNSWKELFEDLGFSDNYTDKFYQEYKNLNTIYLIKSQEYIDKERIIKEFGKNSPHETPLIHFRFTKSLDEASTLMGNNVGIIDKNGKPKLLDYRIKNLGLSTTSVDENGKVVIKSLDSEEALDMLLERSFYRNHVDSGARKVRDLSYKQFEKVKQYEKLNNLKISERVSKIVSQGNTVNLNLMDELTEEFGWINFITGKKEISPEYIRNSLIIEKNLESTGIILDAIDKEFDKIYNPSFKEAKAKSGYLYPVSTHSYATRAEEADKDIIFKRAYNNIIERFTNDPSLARNSKPLIQTSKELNEIDFIKDKLFPSLVDKTKKPNLSNINNDYITINLENDDSILKLFFNNLFGDVKTANLRGAEGYNALYKAYEAIENDERFKGVWGNLTKNNFNKYIENGESPSSLNDRMVAKLRKYIKNKRTDENNSGFGLLFAREIQDPISPYKIFEQFKVNGKYTKEFTSQVEKMVREEMKNIDVKSYAISSSKDNNKKIIDELVNNYFLPFSENDLLKNAKKYTSDQQKVIKTQYHAAKKEARKEAEELINSLYKTNATISIYGKGNNSKIIVSDENKLSQLNYHRYVEHSGIIFNKIGEQEYQVQLGYDISNYSQRGRVRKGRNSNNFSVNKDVKVSNNIERAYNSESALHYTIDNALKSGESYLDAINRKINNVNKVIRESAPRVEGYDYNNMFGRFFDFDTNGIVEILPELKDKGYIDNIALSYNIDSKYVELFKEAIDKIQNEKTRPKNVADLMSSDKNIYLQLFQIGFPKIINEQINTDDLNDEARDIINLINNAVKNTTLTDGKLSINTSPYALGLAGFDKGTRPPQFQAGNNITINKDKLRKDIKKLKENKNTSELAKYLDVTPSTSTQASEHFMFSAGEKRNKTTGLTMQYLQINSNNIKNVLKEDVNKARSGEENKFSKYIKKAYPNMSYGDTLEGAKYLAERSMNLSTFEQESIMDSRLAYIAFSETNIQTIDARKRLMIEHSMNLDVIDESLESNIKTLYPIISNDGTIKYLTGFEVKQGQVLGLFGDNEEIIRAKYNGVFRTRYYKQNGELATEEELNKFISKLKNASHENIIKQLNNNYDLKYEVIPKYDTQGKKIFTEASEKSTINSSDVILGTIDKTLVSDLKKDLKGTDIDVDSLEGTVLSKKYIEEYLYDNLTDKSLKDRILKERFALSEALSEFDTFNGVGLISALDQTKHESVSMPLSDILNSLKNERYKKAMHQAMFISDGSLKYSKDGSLLTDNITGVKIGNFTENDFKGPDAKKTANKLNELFETIDYVYDKNNNIIGYKGVGHIIQLKDDEGGSYSGNMSYISNVKESFTKIINELNSNENLSKNKKEQLENLANKYKTILNKSNEYKGLKYTKNMNNILQRDIYSEDRISQVKEYFKNKGMEDEFNKYFGHIIDNSTNTIKEEYKNKSILQKVTENFRNYLSLSPGEMSIAEVEKLGGSYAKEHKYLIDTFQKDKHSVSIDKAKLMYSAIQGRNAIEYNNSPSKSRLIELTTKGRKTDQFKLIDMTQGERLDLDIGGQGDTIIHSGNTPYNQNLIIKYGKENNDFLAIPRMPEMHHEDKIITSSHVDMLPSLQRVMDEINSGNFKRTELEAKINARDKIIENIKKAQIKDIRGKDGIWNQILETRLDQSFRGIASGFTIDSLGIDLQKLNKSNSKKYLSKLRESNGNLLDKAMFEGKSILEHISEGKVIDTMFLSKEAFDNMGYFDLPFMKKVFKNMNMSKNEMNTYRKYIDIANKKKINEKDEKELIKGMEEILSTHGDVFVATRYPELQEGSSKVTIGFLEHNLKRNEIRTFGPSELSMNADHDGDKISIVRAKNRKNESYIDYITNTKKASSELKEYINEEEASIMSRAVSSNLYWFEKSQEKLAKEMKSSTLKNGSTKNKLEDIAPLKIINGELIKDIIPNKNLTYEKMASYNNLYKDVINIAKQDGKHDNALKYIKANLKDFEVKDYNEALKQYKIGFAFELDKDARIAKSSNKAIGEINVTNNKVKQTLLQLLDPNDKDYNYFTFLTSDVIHKSEEAAISAKSNTKHLEPDRAKIWNKLQTDLISGKGNENKLKLNMKEWANNYLKDDIDLAMHYSNSDLFKNKVKEKLKKDYTVKEFMNYVKDEKNSSTVNEIKEDLINDYVNLLGSLRNTSRTTEILKQLSLGQSQTGVKQSTGMLVQTGYKSNMETIIEKIKNMDLETSNLKIIKSNEKINKKSFSNNNILENNIKNTLNTSKKSISEKALETTKSIAEGISSNKLAVGALALAAGVMIAGFAGGRPRPAETHAMEEANDEATDQTPVLADPGLSYNQATGKNGYIVNISANTSKNKDKVISSMQQIFSNNLNGNININMNYNDNKGNISDREIEKALANVLS